MNDVTPTPKVAAAGLGGAGAVVLIWILRTTTGVDPPAEVAAAFATLLSFAAGWFKS